MAPSSPRQQLDHVISLLFSLLRSPPSSPRRRSPPLPPLSPAGFVSLILGASLAMMLCGSVTLFIGFIIMPWVLGVLFFLHFLGILSNLSGSWMQVLCPVRS